IRESSTSLGITSRSIPPARVARQNVQFGSVFRYRSARNRESSFAQDLDYLLVAQRRVTLFTFHRVENRFCHARVAHRFAARGLIAGGKEIFHLEDALRR